MRRLALFFVLAFALVFSAPASATISSLASQSTQYGNNSQNLFYVSFPVVSTSDVAVVYTDTNGQQTTLAPTQYLVTIFPPVTGQIWSTSASITYPLLGSPIAAGTSLTIYRVIPLTQKTVLSNQGPFYPKVVESALDTNLMQLQQVSARTGQNRGSWITGTAYNFGDIVTDGTNGNNTGNLYTAAISNLSGVWATDLANGDWSLALNIQGIVHSLPTISNNQVFANISGISATPIGVGVSALFDSAIGNTQGNIIYRSGSGWVVLPPGTNGQFLSTGGSAANPSWQTVSGSGTITGVVAGSGLSGGGSSGSVTLNLATVANNSLLANVTGSTNPPSATTASAFLDSVFGSTQGETLYRGGSLWSALAPGTSGQVLTTGGGGANPSWTSTTTPIKAWANFNGSSAAVNKGLNISSITKFATASYTVTFTSNMADANYGVFVSFGGVRSVNGDSAIGGVCSASLGGAASNKTISAVNICLDTTGGAIDYTDVNVEILD